MKQNSKCLWVSLVLAVLLSCGQNPEQITEKVKKKVRKATLRLIDEKGAPGSGFFVAADKIVTNIHVVAGDQRVRVFGPDGTVKSIIGSDKSVIGSDPAHDLVILQVSGEQKGTPLSLSTGQIGERIFVAGYPKEGKYKVTKGIVYDNIHTKIRHDAKTSGGSSGGPVLNIKGEVIGITVGSDGTNLSNAIPSNILKALMSKSKSGQGQSWDEWQKEDSIRAYVYYKSGIKKGEDNKYDEAIEDYTKAIKLYPVFADAYRNRGDVKDRLGDSKLGDSKRENGNVEEARRLVKEARSLYEEAIDDLTKNLDDAYDYYRLASVKSNLGDLEANSKDGNVEKAIKHYQEAIKDYGTSIDKQNSDYPIVLESAYFWRAVVNIRLGEFQKDQNVSKARKHYDAAIKDFEETIKLGNKLGKGFVNAYSNLGYTKCLLGKSFESEEGQENIKHAQNLYKAAIDDSNNAIRLNSKYASAYGVRGIANAGLKDYDEAIADLSKAIELKPDDAEFYRERGLVRQKIGRQKEADADFQEAKKIDPDIETK